MIFKNWKNKWLSKSDQESLDTQAIEDLKNGIMQTYKRVYASQKAPGVTTQPAQTIASGSISFTPMSGQIHQTQSAYPIGNSGLGSISQPNNLSTTISDLAKEIDDMHKQIKTLTKERDEARKYAELYRDKYIQLKRGVTANIAQQQDEIRKQLFNPNMLNQNDPVIKNLQEQFDSMFNEDQK